MKTIKINTLHFFHVKQRVKYNEAMQEWREGKRQTMPFEPMYFYYLTDKRGNRMGMRKRGHVVEWASSEGGNGNAFFLNRDDAGIYAKSLNA